MISIRDYQDDDSPSVGILIADTFGEFNLSHVAAEERDRFLGPFRHARSLAPAYRKDIADAIRAHWVFVAEEDDGEIVGVLRGKPGKLQSLFVRADRHRQGIGRALVNRFEYECLQAGVPIVRLQATLYAVDFYQSLGYVRSTGVRSGRIFEGTGFRYQPMKKVLGVAKRPARG
jgi:GNAT superfamily N-acetyltransferase